MLTVKIAAPEEDIFRYLERQVIRNDNPQTTPALKAVIEDSYQSADRPGHRAGDPKPADGERRGRSHPVCLARTLQQLLMQPPIAGQVVLGWDPAFRTGCKLAVVDATGKVLDTTVIYPTAPHEQGGGGQGRC